MGGGNKVGGERLGHVLVDLAMVHVEDVTLWTEHELSKSIQAHLILWCAIRGRGGATKIS